MVDPGKLKGMDFAEHFESLETAFVGELENMIFAQLLQHGKVSVGDTEDDVLEFSGRTNFKIRVKRPRKNVWSIPVQLLKDSIRKVLREGRMFTENNEPTSGKRKKPSNLDLPIKLLLQSIPREEFFKRSFVGNSVEHEVYGEGVIKRITDTGNVEIVFGDRVALLKPGFFKLKVS